MPDASAALANSEAEQLLTGMARGRFGRIAPDRIARHVLAAFPDADWPVRKAAFDALARRFGFAQRDGLRVAERPEQTFGSYRTLSTSHKSKGRGAQRELGPRPYETALYCLDPLRMSCACADFVRSSLGLCKHGLVVLETLEQRGLLASAADGGVLELAKPWLGWDSAHPAHGAADRLARLTYAPAANAKSAAPSGWNRGRPSESQLRDLEQRLAFIDELERALRAARLLAEPAVPTLLSEERERAERRSAARALLPVARKSLSGLGRKLYPYQREGVLRFFETGRLLLADDMGLGKTTQAIAICHALFAAESIQRGLLIVPNPLKTQWQREWEATTDAPLSLVEGSPKERKQLYERTRRGVLIIGYEQLLRDLEHVQRFAPEIVVLDEAQRIKNWATKSAAYVKSLAPAYRLVLTGTPMENRFDELASIMDFVDDIVLEPKWRLVPFHSVVSEETGRTGGARNLSVLRERLSTAMLRRLRSEVLTQLPARTDTRVPVELTEVQQSRHEELRQPIAVLMSKAQRRPLQQAEFLQLMQLLTKQRMICNGMAQVQFESEWPRCEHVAPTPAVLESLFTPKLSVLRGLVEQVVLEQGRKAVVFSQWRKMLCFAEWAVRDLLSAAGMRALFFTGAETSSARERAIRDFNDDPHATLLFLSDAGGVGLNLQHAASCCINLELPWNPAVLEQRIGRVYRLGQKLPIDVYNLVADEGIEGRIAQLIANKKAVFSSLFDGTSDEVVWDGGGSFLDSVRKLVDPVVVPEAAGLEDVGEPLSLPPTAAESEPPAPATVPFNLPGLQVTRLPDGGVRIEANAALAAPLADLLEQLAKSLRP